MQEEEAVLQEDSTRVETGVKERGERSNSPEWGSAAGLARQAVLVVVLLALAGNQYRLVNETERLRTEVRILQGETRNLSLDLQEARQGVARNRLALRWGTFQMPADAEGGLSTAAR